MAAMVSFHSCGNATTDFRPAIVPYLSARHTREEGYQRIKDTLTASKHSVPGNFGCASTEDMAKSPRTELISSMRCVRGKRGMRNLTRAPLLAPSGSVVPVLQKARNRKTSIRAGPSLNNFDHDPEVEALLLTCFCVWTEASSIQCP